MEPGQTPDCQALAQNLLRVQDRIDGVCARIGRDPSSVTLVAVSKTFSADHVRALYDLGHRDFGENRVQEASTKIPDLPGDIRWHYIGKVQTNKARKIADLFDEVHSVESDLHMQHLDQTVRTLGAFLQVNVGREPQKSGIFPEALDSLVPSLLKYQHVELTGLMTIGPWNDDPEASRGLFRQLAECAQRVGLTRLSMGMSHDLEVAIEEGATHIRVGTALFGHR